MEQPDYEHVHALAVTQAVGDAIRELGQVPSGHLYAQLMTRMSLETYEGIIRALKGAGLVAEQNHLLRWVGPTQAMRGTRPSRSRWTPGMWTGD